MSTAFTHDHQSALLVRVKNVILVLHDRMARETAIDGASRIWLEHVGRGLIVKKHIGPSLSIWESLALLFEQEHVLQGVRHVYSKRQLRHLFRPPLDLRDLGAVRERLAVAGGGGRVG